MKLLRKIKKRILTKKHKATPKSSKWKIYNSLASIPIIKYHLAIKDKELRHLIKGFDIDDLPDIPDWFYLDLAEANEKLTTQRDDFNLSLQESYMEVLAFRLEYEKGEIKVGVYNSVFGRYLQSLGEVFTDFSIRYIDNGEQKSEVFKSPIDTFKFYSKTFGFEYSEKNKHLDFDYTSLDCKPKHQHDIYEDIQLIKEELSLDVDENNWSAKKFFNLREKAYNSRKKKISRQKQKDTKRN